MRKEDFFILTMPKMLLILNGANRFDGKWRMRRAIETVTPFSGYTPEKITILP